MIILKSNLLYASCSVFFGGFFVKEMLPTFLFFFPLLGMESQKCVAACSTGTVAQWPSI